MTAFSLRPYLPRDAAAVAQLFQDSIFELAGEEYSERQCAAWAASADDLEEFSARLERMLTLVIESEEGIAGFASLEDNEMISMLYVAPRYARMGVASALCDALEKLAAGRGKTTLITDASDAGQYFFSKRGYVPMRRNTIQYDEEWLGNTTMQKRLEPAAKPLLQ